MAASLPKPPTGSRTHLLADWLEFCALVSLDEWSPADLESQQKRNEEVEPEASDPRDADDPELLADDLLGLDRHASAQEAVLNVLLDEGGDLEPDASKPPAAEIDAEEDDARAAQADDVASHLRYRSRVFGDAYPFDVDPETGAITPRALTETRRLYAFLLLASALGWVEKGNRPRVTQAFERLSVPVLRAYLPSAEVHLVGTASGGSGRFKGTLAQKLTLLSQALRLKLAIDPAEITPQNVGDAGLDAVAWFDLDDDAPKFLIVFAQATCSKRWPKKQHEAAEIVWSQIYTFPAPLANLLLIPYCFRRPGGEWFNSLELQQGILFDRVRIIALLRSNPAAVSLPAVAMKAAFEFS